MAGFEKYEDAAVYRLSEKQALIFTLDSLGYFLAGDNNCGRSGHYD
ncbi:unnamed protein product [marine sediment metagenome]|uniref:Uncharacterized protein n=1 Tax=marine sediment metagenome TaxID=412755 RepID=X1MYQ1_9ZZZZ